MNCRPCVSWKMQQGLYRLCLYVLLFGSTIVASNASPPSSSPPDATASKFAFTRTTRIVIDSHLSDQLSVSAYWVQCYLCRVTGYSSPVTVGTPSAGDVFLTLDSQKSDAGYTLKMVDVQATDGAQASSNRYVRIGGSDPAGVFKGSLRLMGYLKTSTTLTSQTLTAPPKKEIGFTRVYQIAAGGPSYGTFDQDAYFWGDTSKAATLTVPPSSINLTGAVDPAPAEVYTSERFGDTAYAFPNLKPGQPYLVRLHFAEIYYMEPGKRIFNVAINGTYVLKNFDIVATAGAPYKVVIEEFTVPADQNGQIVVVLSTGQADLPKISALEIISVN